MHSRREFGKMAFSATALAATSSFLTTAARAAVTKIQTTFKGVRLGTCMYCFRDIPRTEDQEAYLNEMVRQLHKPAPASSR